MIFAAIVLLVVVVILGFFAFVAILPLLIAGAMVAATKAPYAPKFPKWYTWVTMIAGGACSLSIIIDVFNDNVDIGGTPLAIMGGYAFISLLAMAIYMLTHTDEIKQKKKNSRIGATK